MRKILSLFLMTFVSVMMFAATETTVYYTVPAATIGTYSVKLNVNFKGDGDDWHQFDMTKTALTNNGDPVYSYKYTDAYDGVGVMQFQLYDGETWKSQKVAISSWTAVATYNGKMYVHATEQWVAAPAGGGESGSDDSNVLYVWNGIGSTTDAIEKGGEAEAVQTTGTNMEVGNSQKGNYCFKMNKGFTKGEYYIGIALENSVNAGDTVRIAYFRTGDKSTYVLGMDFSADKASVATTYQILSQGDPQVLASNGTPVDSIYIVPEGVANAKYIRLYRNSGSTGVYVAKFELLKKVEQGGEGGDDPVAEEPAVIKMHGNFTGDWANTDAFTLSEDKKTATLKLTLNKGNYEFGMRIGSDDNWTSNGVAFTRENKSAAVAAGTGNLKLAADTKGDYTFTWTYANNTLAIDFPEYVETLPEMQIAGAWEVKDDAWVKNAMTPAEDKKTASYEVELKAGDYEFKVIKDGAWLAKANEGNAYGLHRDWTGVAGVVDQNTSENLKLTADVDGKYTFVWTFANDSLGVVFPAKPVELQAVSEATTWDFSKITANKDNSLYGNDGIKLTDESTPSKNDEVVYANYSADFMTFAEGFDATTMAFKGEYPIRKNQYCQAGTLRFKTTVAGTITVKFSDTGSSASATAVKRYLVVNGEQTEYWTSRENNGEESYAAQLNVTSGEIAVPAGDVTITGSSAIIMYNVTFTPEAPAKFYITGNEALLGEKAWNPAAIKVTEDSYTFENLAAGDYKLKVTDGAWNSEETPHMNLGYDALTQEDKTGLTADNDNNICFTLKEAGNVVVTYKVVDKVTTFTVTGNFYVRVPEYKDLYLVPGVWAEADAKIAAWIWGKELDGQWTAFFAGEGDTLTAKVNADADSIIFVRFNSAVETPAWSDEEGVIWNKANDQLINECNLFVINDWNLYSWCQANPFETWFGDANWKPETESNLVYDEATKTATITIAQNKNGQWQAQVKYHGAPAKAGKYYDLSFKLKANKTFGGITVKYQDNAQMLYETTVALEENVELAYAKKDLEGLAGNGILVLDFGYAAAGTVITLSDVAIVEKDKPDEVVLPVMQIAGAWEVDAENGNAWVLNAMTPAENKKTASYEVELKAGDYEFKVIKDGAWLTKANEGSAYGLHRDWTGVAGVTDDVTENIKLTADVDGKYTFVWTFANDSIGVVFPALPVKYCEFPTGHHNQADFGDANARILLTIQKIADSNNLRVAVKNNNANGNTKTGLNYLWVNATGAKNNNATYGSHDAEDVEEVSVIVEFDEAQESYVFNNIHWAYAGWGGEWAIDGLTVLASELCEAPETPAKFYITGDSALVVNAGLDKEKAWAPDAIKVTEDSYTFENLAVGDYKLKVTDGAWSSEETPRVNLGFSDLTQEDKAGLTADKDNNICFTLKEAGNVVVTCKKVENVTTFTVTGNFYVPAEPEKVLPKVGLGANFNGWNWEANLFTPAKDSITASIKVNLGVTDTIQFKIVSDGSWLSLNGEGETLYRLHRDWNKAEHVNLINEGRNFSLVADAAGEYTFTWTYADSTLVVTFPEKGEPTLADGYYLVGKFGGVDAWTVVDLTEDKLFVSTGIETGEYSLNVTLAEGDEFKVVRVEDDAIKTWFPEGDNNNYKVDANHAGAKTIYFRPEYNGNDDWHAKCIYVAPNSDTPTGINAINVDAKAVKVLRNGILVIEKNGKAYNAMGQTIR